MMNEGPILKPGKKIAKELGISYSWLIRAAKDGRVPHIRIGNHIRFIRDEIIEALRAGN